MRGDNIMNEIKEQDIALGLVVIMRGPNVGNIGLIVNV